jgi:predicted nucleic acid-binding protein
LTLVVDASMALAWMLADEAGPEPSAAEQRVVAEGAVVPSFWRLEVANALRNAVRRKRCSEFDATRSLHLFDRLRIEVDPESDIHAWGATRKLSRQYDLTVYDAAYLELAIRRKLPLASRDDELLAAARKARVETVTE